MLAAFHNLPHPWLAKTVRTLMFPYGKPFSPPDDKLIHQVARLILEPSATRDRLTAGVYITNDPADRMGRIEDALHKTLAAAEVEKQLRVLMKSGKLAAHTIEDAIQEAKEKNLLDKFSVERLLAARRATLNAIRVDDFPAEYFRQAGITPTAGQQYQAN
jgi:acyl-CoA dehydrogenase